MAKSHKSFDHSKFKQRHVAFKILYFGWDYDGLAAQKTSENTVEFNIFQALIKTCLIESRDNCNYNRCGRTDKGVSSYGQVIDLNVRSQLIDESNPKNVGLFTPPNYTGKQIENNLKTVEDEEDIHYVDILNRVLPDHIKVIAWAPVRADFSSRFSCQSRSYSYVFPLGDLDIELMKTAAMYLVGEHDFRNLCSFDLKNGVTSHKRTILSTSIEPVNFLTSNNHQALAPASSEKTNKDSPFKHYTFYEVVIVGQAFLYHQIRCIMTILFQVGNRKESPQIVRDLLDISKCPAKPHYNPAQAMPLCLFNCQYLPGDLPLGWQHDVTSLSNLLRKLKNLWLKYRTKALMIERVLADLEASVSADKAQQQDHKSNDESARHRWKDFGLECDNMGDTKYVPILKRPRDETLESKLETLNRKRRAT